ncbi:MFS transporter [Nakamurella leprariae]|uniref:MFS transporter n=1 Tax=Nakamurella leprariae TaxID=2803911 RepID=A0A938YB21_9ACTN|nr:MFS transporter [Nakamurella leprariae]MBM9466348.1 MFS transporter [Nakamurella leprariae]
MNERSGLRDLAPIAVPAYGPTLVGAIGTGAVLPVIALSAVELGAGVGMAALLVALLGIGQLIADLPAGALAARLGERRALMLACGLEFAGGLGALVAPNVLVLGASVLVIGFAAAVFGLARQSWLTAAVPVGLRARALSTLGGVARIGMFIGPFVGALAITLIGIRGAYLVDMIAAVAAFALVAGTRDLTGPPAIDRAGPPADPVDTVDTVDTVDPSGPAGPVRPAEPERGDGVLRALVRHRRVLGTLGVGVLLLSLARSGRNTIIPLWAAASGLSAAQVSLVVGIAGAVDMLLFYPAGAVMDRRGRLAVALPSLAVMSAGFVLLTVMHGFVPVLLAAMLLALGNGIGAGVVMTLGADAAPAAGRPQFLAGWRLMADSGAALGPALIAVVTAVATLAWAAVLLAVLSVAGGLWLRRYVPALDPVIARPADQVSQRRSPRHGRRSTRTR